MHVALKCCGKRKGNTFSSAWLLKPGTQVCRRQHREPCLRVAVIVLEPVLRRRRATYLCVWRHACTCVTWLIRLWAITRLYVWHDTGTDVMPGYASNHDNSYTPDTNAIQTGKEWHNQRLDERTPFAASLHNNPEKWLSSTELRLRTRDKKTSGKTSEKSQAESRYEAPEARLSQVGQKQSLLNIYIYMYTRVYTCIYAYI